MINAKVVADSKNEFGNRITTMVVTFPRIILAEFNTHRMFSRNSASSRAIPFEKMLKSVQENPFVPIAWQKDHKGMQGTEYFDNIEEQLQQWHKAKYAALSTAKMLSDVGTTKQLCNRLLEPFMWHTVIVTATEWENFFALRCPQYSVIDKVKDNQPIYKYFRSRKDYIKEHISNGGTLSQVALPESFWFTLNVGQAEIHMMALAEAMWDAYSESTPKELKAGEWHIPYEDVINSKFYLDQLMLSPKYSRPISVEISTMMAARTSYTVVGEDSKEWTMEKYRENHDKLITAKPLHASPLEHCAKAMNGQEHYASRGKSGNFFGFIQYRKMIPHENIV